MSVIFSIVFIFFGVNSALQFCRHNYTSAIVWFLIAALSLVALISQVIATQKKEKAEKAKVDAISNLSDANQLKELKGLLDSGIITQEEFDAKKKQILNI